MSKVASRPEEHDYYIDPHETHIDQNTKTKQTKQTNHKITTNTDWEDHKSSC